MNLLKRVEIIANHSVQEEMTEALTDCGLMEHFTLIPRVQGQGNTEPKRGDHVWPEENFILIIYAETEMAEAIARVVEEVRADFPDEGIRCFVTG